MTFFIFKPLAGGLFLRYFLTCMDRLFNKKKKNFIYYYFRRVIIWFSPVTTWRSFQKVPRFSIRFFIRWAREKNSPERITHVRKLFFFFFLSGVEKGLPPSGDKEGSLIFTTIGAKKKRQHSVCGVLYWGRGILF